MKRYLFWLAFFFLWFVLPGVALAEKVTLYPTADAAIDEHFIDANYNDSGLTIGRLNNLSSNRRWSAFMFDLSTVPRDSHIISAKLSIYSIYNSTNFIIPINVRRLSGAWTESGITWKNKPSSEAIDDSGFISLVNNWGLVDVKDLVEDWVRHGWHNYGFFLTDGSSTKGVLGDIASSEANSSQRPKLVIEFNPPNTPTPTPTIRITRLITNTPTPTIRIARLITNTPTPTPDLYCTTNNGQPRILMQNLHLENLTSTGVRVVWNSRICNTSRTGYINHNTNSLVYADPNANENTAFSTFDRIVTDQVQTSDHSVQLNSLSPGTRYKYRIFGEDQNRNSSVSPLYEFTTPLINIRNISATPTPNTSNCSSNGQPKIFIQNLHFEIFTSTAARLAWNTRICNPNGVGFIDHETTSWIYADPNATEQTELASFDRNFGNHIMASSHSIPMNPLLAGTLYRYRVYGRDRNNNETFTPLIQFSTPAAVGGDDLLSPDQPTPTIPLIDLDNNVDGGQDFSSSPEDNQSDSVTPVPTSVYDETKGVQPDPTDLSDSASSEIGSDKNSSPLPSLFTSLINPKQSNTNPALLLIIAILLIVLLLIIFLKKKNKTPTPSATSPTPTKRWSWIKIFKIIVLLLVLKFILDTLTFFGPSLITGFRDSSKSDQVFDKITRDNSYILDRPSVNIPYHEVSSPVKNLSFDCKNFALIPYKNQDYYCQNIYQTDENSITAQVTTANPQRLFLYGQYIYLDCPITTPESSEPIKECYQLAKFLDNYQIEKMAQILGVQPPTKKIYYYATVSIDQAQALCSQKMTTSPNTQACAIYNTNQVYMPLNGINHSYFLSSHILSFFERNSTQDPYPITYKAKANVPIGCYAYDLHEIVHLLSRDYLSFMPTWFEEGMITLMAETMRTSLCPPGLTLTQMTRQDGPSVTPQPLSTPIIPSDFDLEKPISSRLVHLAEDNQCRQAIFIQVARNIKSQGPSFLQTLYQNIYKNKLTSENQVAKIIWQSSASSPDIKKFFTDNGCSL